jgi:hypothetical protein
MRKPFLIQTTKQCKWKRKGKCPMKPLNQIEISAQVWVCDSCGGTDHKSCSCRATAHSEELKKKKEQDRQRAKAYRDRAASRDADIKNIEELSVPLPVLAPIPSRFERKDVAKFTRLVDGLMTADLARDLYDELRAHGATRLMESLDRRLSPGREQDESGPAATDTIN